jgi:hypothetical protein
VLADFYLDALRRQVGFTSELINADQPEVVDRLAGAPAGSLIGGLRRLSEADANLGRNAQVELALETLFIHLAAAARGTLAARAAG